ncbi:uncharacterized protein ANIA_05943 [Aspergillus nidulans FGSC A4]|uniref:Rhodopsin domain-containing protein n=1 Tax=Emericella nidulans (strain FGSC A4 / ATCC 38163 / CBS 112.46 / NRRL 194 / M139) TaxID=227321 RepID=C8V3H6_EMENI|nr:hypothetical protein [Aspergillus nidulans FGSC A4]CBF70516.1 TPA: conserved hypothetical protein [Aspergillus nidulans FGSC A4]
MARPDTGQVVAWYVCTVVACVFLVARLAVRWRLLKRLYIDDVFVALAALCLIGDLAIQHYMFNQGMSDMAHASTENAIRMMKMIIPGSTLYVTSLWLIKASMVIFYKRLADRTKYQTIYNITLAVLGATWLVLFLDIVLKCYPPNRQWKGLTDPTLACPEKPTTVNYWLTILFNIFSDVFIICLPISQVARLKMPSRQKWGVISVFLLGGLVVITSIIRAIYSHRNEQMITCTVSMIETAIAIIASCLPVLRTLVFGSHSRTGTYSSNKRRGYELSSSGGLHSNSANVNSKHRTTVSVSLSRSQTVISTPGLSGTFGARSGTRLGSQDERDHETEFSRHESEDELVEKPVNMGPGIAVRHEYFVHEDGQSLHAR